MSPVLLDGVTETAESDGQIAEVLATTDAWSLALGLSTPQSFALQAFAERAANVALDRRDLDAARRSLLALCVAAGATPDPRDLLIVLAITCDVFERLDPDFPSVYREVIAESGLRVPEDMWCFPDRHLAVRHISQFGWSVRRKGLRGRRYHFEHAPITRKSLGLD